MEMSICSQQSYFVTLTFDPDNVPRTSSGEVTLQKKKMQKWVQNQVKEIGNFRYLLVGEYGKKHGRPHYHLALFPGQNCDGRMLAARWKKGHTSTYPLASGAAEYMLKDLAKGIARNTEILNQGDPEPPFRTSSRKPPLGAPYIPILVHAYSTESGQQVIKDRGDVERTIRFGQKIYPLPRYILGKLRAELGIPRLHSERMAHPGYYEIHSGEEHAEWEPDEALAQEIHHAAKKKALDTRGYRL